MLCEQYGRMQTATWLSGDRTFICVYGHIRALLQIIIKRKITKNRQEKGRLNIARR